MIVLLLNRIAELIVGTESGELYQIGVQDCEQRPVPSDQGTVTLPGIPGAPVHKHTVKDFMKRLCMRQICPFCAQPCGSIVDSKRDACQTCFNLSTATAKLQRVANSAKTSLLCRLLYHMTSIFDDKICDDRSSSSEHDRIHLPSGVYSVPLSATLMLQVCLSFYVFRVILYTLTRNMYCTHSENNIILC